MRLAAVGIIVAVQILWAPLAAEASLKTARALGLRLPQSIMIRADRVIE